MARVCDDPTVLPHDLSSLCRDTTPARAQHPIADGFADQYLIVPIPDERAGGKFAWRQEGELVVVRVISIYEARNGAFELRQRVCDAQ